MSNKSLRVLSAVLTACAATSALSQTITPISHNGQNIAYCGPVGGGPLVQHNFSGLGPTHDDISVSEPGSPNWSASAAASHQDATPLTSAFALANAGSSSRGLLIGFGVYATADSRDNWSFTVSAPACFTFSASMSGNSSENVSPVQSYAFGPEAPSPGQIIPDPGTPPDAFSQFLNGPGSVARSASGTLLPGRYGIYLNGRVEGNAYPFSGSFNGAIALTLSAPTLLTMPTPASVCPNATATFSVTSAVGGATTFRWQIETTPTGSNIWADLTNGPLPPATGSAATASGTTTSTLTITNADTQAATRYRCRVTDTCGNLNSDPAALTVTPCQVPGDMNCDGAVNDLDVGPFLLALTNLTAYQQQFPTCNPLNGDLNHDMLLNGLDIGMFIACVFNGGCP